jgi:hypothetical protein
MSAKSPLNKISKKEILRKLNKLSIDQINAQGKLFEVWKSLNIPGYLTKWEISNAKTDFRTRSRDKQSLNEQSRSKIMTSQ